MDQYQAMGEMLPDQMLRSCRRCDDQTRQYRLSEPRVEDELLVAEFECVECMEMTTVIIDPVNVWDEVEALVDDKRDHTKAVL